MPTEIRLLGRFSVRRDGEEIPPGAFRQRRVRTLVRILVTRRGQFWTHDALSEALWGEGTPADPVANVRVLVNLARRALGDATLISTGPAGYSFTGDDRCLVDAELFVSKAQAGRDRLAARQAGAALQELGAALELWGGEPLAEDMYADWASEYRATLNRTHLYAIEAAATAALALRDPVQAVGFAEQAVAKDPLRERAHLLLVRALAECGDRAGALAAFDHMRRLLGEELGLDPSAEALELQMHILRGESVAGLAPRPLPSRSQTLPDALPFVGREAEMEQILGALHTSGRRTAVVVGPAGTGKTRLLDEVAARVGAPVIAARAFSAERDEAWGLARSVLREALTVDVDAARALPERAAAALADVVPELEEFRAIVRTDADEQSRRALALEGGLQLIAAVASRGVVVAVDDLQWADPTSLALLSGLSRRRPDAPMIVAYRPEEVAEEGPVGRFLEELAECRTPVEVVLGGLTPRALGHLVVEEDLAEAISRETDRTPFAVAEVIRELARQGAVRRDLAGRWQARRSDAVTLACEAARAGQRRAIMARSMRHPARRRTIVLMLALLGREAPARLISKAADREQVLVLADLDRLAFDGLVGLGDGGWRITHDLIGETLAEGLSRPARGSLHGRLAHALESEGGDPAEIASHLCSAGDVDAAGASFARAGRQRLDRFATEEALRLAEAGLTLSPSEAVRLSLLDTRAEARARQGDVVGARDDLRAVVAGTGSGADRSRLLSRLATLSSGAESYALAEELVDLALTEAGADKVARSRALAVAMFLDINAGRLEEADAHAAEALDLFRDVGDGHGIAEVLEARAMIALVAGKFAATAEMLDRASRLFRESGDLLRVGVPRGLRAWTLMWMGQLDDALADADEGVALCRSLGDTEGEAFCSWYRSEVLSALLRPREALEAAERVLALAEQIGHHELTADACLGIGAAHEGLGNLESAEAAYRKAVAAAEGIVVTTSLARARLGSVLVALGHLDEAEGIIGQALSAGCPSIELMARLAEAELAIAIGVPDGPAKADEAIRRARACGLHLHPGHPSALVRQGSVGTRSRRSRDASSPPGVAAADGE